jgi:hypothetical protein
MISVASYQFFDRDVGQEHSYFLKIKIACLGFAGMEFELSKEMINIFKHYL